MRIGQLTEEQKKIINKTEKIDDEKAIKEFIKSRRLKNVRESTIRYYEDAFRVLYRDLEKLSINKTLLEVTEMDLEAIIEHWQGNLKVTSINSKIRAIKPFYKFLFEKKYIKKNPCEHISILRDRIKIRETLEKNEIKKINNYLQKKGTFISYRDSIIFQLLLDTGLRINEALNLKTYLIQGNKIVVSETKNNEQRIAFMSKKMQERMEAYLKVRNTFDLNNEYVFINQDGKQLKKNTYQERLREAARAVGIKKQVSPHVCRRTFAKNCVLKGMDPFTLQVLLGHSTLEVTKRYVQIYGQDLEKQAQKKDDFSDIF